MDENPCIVRLSNSWIIMNPGGPPTPDKPDISVVDYEPSNTTSMFMSLRVANIQACYEEWKTKGADFVTPNALEDRLSVRATTPAANPPISAIASECVAPRCPKGPHTGHRTENR
jgi:hypothetical protein